MSIIRRTTNVSVSNPPVDRSSERGAALLLALALLAVFGILGTFYVKHMNLSLTETSLGYRQMRAQHLAAAGVEFAAEGLRLAVTSPNHTVPMGVPSKDIDFSTYRGISQTEDGIAAEAMGTPRLAIANVTVFDESSKLNINHASAGVLQKILGVSPATAQKVVASASAEWFLSLDELLTRGLLTQKEYDLLIPSLLTTYSVTDHAHPSQYMNVNKADPAVLAAVLNVTQDQAAQVAAKRPFRSLAALSDAVTAVTGVPATNVEGNPALALESRCFQVVSTGRYATAKEKSNALRHSAQGRVEAVLLFKGDGSYQVIHWDRHGDAADADPA